MSIPRNPPANRKTRRAPGEIAKPARACKDEEHQHQAAFVEWANITSMTIATDKERRIGDYLFAIPNGGFRSASQGARLRAEGVKAGVWDMFFALPVGGWPGLWLEFKSADGRMTEEQHAWRRLIAEAGYQSMLVRSVDQAILGMRQYLGWQT